MLLLITLIGICYLFIPTFYIEGQTNLIDALKVDGAIYSEKKANFLPYLPFAFLYCVELVKRIMKRTLSYFDVFAVCIMGYFALIYLGLMFGKVSLYYMFKNYFILWLVIFEVTIGLVNHYIDVKIAKWIIPLYVVCWGSFVFMWVWIKAGHILGEEEKHALPNYVGMYYFENCEYRKLIDLTQNFKKEQIELVDKAKELIPDMKVENTNFITNGIYQRTWLTAYSEIESDIYKYNYVLEDTTHYTIENSILDVDKKYIICTSELPETREELEKYRDSDEIEILYENIYGYVVEIKR